MDYVAKALHRLTYDRVAYEPIRDDFISWYFSAYNDLSLDNQMDRENEEIVEMAIETRYEAITYEPDTTLNTAIKITTEADKIIKFVSALLTSIGFIAGCILISLGVINPLSGFTTIMFAVLGSGAIIIPGSALPFYMVIKYTIQTNSELIRLYNEEMVVSLGRIRKNKRWSAKTTAFYIHHSSLCSTTQIPVIVFLGVLRVVSPKTYGIVCQRLKADISEYNEDNFWKVMGKEYARVKKEALPSVSK
jgi:hypothetical protein